MILIISNNADVTTNDVIDWLSHFRYPFERINETDVVRIKQIRIEDNQTSATLLINNQREIELNRVTAYWYRRGLINPHLNKTTFEIFSELDPLLSEYTANFHRNEYESITDFLHLYLGSVKHLNSIYDDQRINKLHALRLATMVGLNVPETSILTSFESGVPEKSINKAIRHGFGYTIRNVELLGFTQKVTPEKLANIDHHSFFPTLFQAEVRKQFELRIFFFENHYYASAIFSQNNSKTIVDFRRYDHEKPNRVVPFRLPVEILNKLKQLMARLNLNSGSIDMIVDMNDTFYFLEVNPVGQFKQVSVPCNYPIEHDIANYLCHD